MEIRTTLVTFSFPKAGMETKTESAQLFTMGSEKKPKKVWVPLNKLIIKPDESDPSNNIVTMAKWLYMKSELPYYTECTEKVHLEIIEDVDNA